MVSRASDPSDVSFLEGGGELGALMRAHPWQETPLGPPASWPRSLKTAVRILLTSRQPFWLGWGPDLTFLYNDPYKAIIGGKHPSALGRPFREVWHEIWDVVGPMAHHVMTQDEGTYVEAQRLVMQRHGYQEETYYTFSYSPVPDDDGQPGGLICANTDDTRRVIGERQLGVLRELAARTAEARGWREACGLALQALATDPDDVPFAMVYVTDGALALIGATPGAPDAPRWPLDEVLTEGVPRSVPRADGASGVVLWPLAPSQTGRRGVLAVGLSPIRVYDEGYRGFLELVAGGVASALANAEAHELERARAEALAELDRAKTAFFSNVSHEFRTPLTLVLGPLEGLLEDPALAPEPRESLALVHRNALRLQKLVNTLLDFSRIEAGRMQATYEPTALGPLTRELASLFRSTVEGAGLTLRIDVDADLPVVYVDRDLWEKIVLNLLSNAFKFTFEGEIGVILRAHDGGVTLEVNDTGTGIPDDELPHLFERFRRVQGARGRSFEGSGIGLALVQELVHMHGGQVGVRSTLGRGSTFTVTIPSGVAHLPPDRIGAPAASGAASTAAEPSAVLAAHVQEIAGWRASAPSSARTAEGRPYLLLADDNADVREYLQRILDAQYEIHAVPDGRSALESARARRPDLVVTDAMMPVLDGFGLLRELRGDEQLATVPVLMLSARAGEESRIDGISAGADDYLVKPFSARELSARVASRLELVRLRERLREERELVTHLFEQMPVPIAVLRGEALVFELANPAYRRTVGGRDVIGRPYLEALPEITDQGFVALMREVLRSGEPWFGDEIPARFDRRGDGTLEDSWWSFVLAPLRGADGGPESVVAISTEVTDRVVGRTALERSEARYRHIFESAAVAILELDPSDVHRTGAIDAVRLIDANPASRKMLGGDAARPLPLEIGPVLAEALEALRAGLAAEAQPYVAETAVRRLDGTRLDVLLTVSRPFDPTATVLVTLVDITERRRAEAVLQEEAETLELLNRIGATLAGDLDLRRIVQAVTEASTAASGARFGAFVTVRPDLQAGMMLQDLAWLGEPGLTRVRAVLAGGPAARIDDLGSEPAHSLLVVPVVSRSGERLGALVLTHPERGAFTVRAEQRVSGMAYQAAVAMDNARLHEQRQALIEQLREADRRKDEFLATLSHELRNPLAPLRNALHLLRLGDRAGTSMLTVRAMMERQVEHLVRLVDDLLEVSRINRGRIELRLERVDLGAIVRNAMEATEPLVAAGGHRLALDLPEAPVWVEGDPVRLAQILTNLLSNAAKYTDRGTIEVRLTRGADGATVSVRDDGAGISAEALPRLFEMFSRGDQANGRGPGGLGVGLALARRLAEEHGGTLTARSDGRGLGSEFTLRLPAVDRPGRGGLDATVTSVERQRVLVVDDNVDAADSLAMLLEVLGAEVRVAHHGSAALEVYPAFRPAMVLLDIGMPDLDGYDVARAMRAEHADIGATIVALTGWGQEEDRRRARAAGFDHHLIKPADLAEIQRLLGSLTER